MKKNYLMIALAVAFIVGIFIMNTRQPLLEAKYYNSEGELIKSDKTYSSILMTQSLIGPATQDIRINNIPYEAKMIKYTLYVRNTGSDPVNVTLTSCQQEVLGQTHVTISCLSGSNNKNLGTLVAGQSIPINLSVDANPGGSMPPGNVSISVNFQLQGGIEINTQTFNFLSKKLNLPSLFYQESADSYSTDSSSTETNYFYANYPKPTNAISSVWQVKHGTLSTYNISIPSSCFRDTIKVRILSGIMSGGCPPYTYGSGAACCSGTIPYCYDGTNWIEIGSRSLEAKCSYSEAGLTTTTGSSNDGNWNTYSAWTSNVAGYGWYTGGLILTNAPTKAIYEESMIWTMNG